MSRGITSFDARHFFAYELDNLWPYIKTVRDWLDLPKDEGEIMAAKLEECAQRGLGVGGGARLAEAHAGCLARPSQIFRREIVSVQPRDEAESLLNAHGLSTHEPWSPWGAPINR